MQLRDGDLPSGERLKDLITYDVVPEIESYLLEVGKRLHISVDASDATKKQFEAQAPKTDDIAFSHIDDEEVKGDDEDVRNPKTVVDDEAAAAEEKGDIFERVDAVFKACEQKERELEEA